jgi:hypothetical protein
MQALKRKEVKKMSDESVNFKQAIIQLRAQMNDHRLLTKELDQVLHDIDAPLWSLSLDVELLKKISDAVNRSEKKTKIKLDQLLETI